MIKVATYARVSTAQHQSPEAQIFELRRYCGARDWKIAHEIVDHGFSGGTARRPGLKQLFDLVKRREVQGVVVVKLDRLFRSVRHLITTLEEFQALGVTFCAISDNVDYSTPSGRLFVQILGSLAEFERSLLRERTVMGLQHARRKGVRLGRPQQHDPEEIRRLRQRGLSYTEIGKKTGAPPGCIARALRGTRKTCLSK
jgi:DNA invertase Pin-like site-specific DNA recombinase